MITIRDADLDKDAPMIMVGARDFAGRVAFQSLMPTSDEKFTEAVSKIVTLPGFELLIAEYENIFVGMIGILYVPFQWNPDILAAEEIFWWTAKDAPYRTGYTLFKEAMRRIDSKGAIPFFRELANSPGRDKFDKIIKATGIEKLYREEGMTMIETVHGRV